MSGDRVAVILDVKQKAGTEVDKEEKDAEQPADPPVYWIHGNMDFFNVLFIFVPRLGRLLYVVISFA